MNRLSLAQLAWQSRLVEALPGDPERGNFTRQVPGASYSEVHPTPVRAPRLLAWSGRLADELGLTPATEADLQLLAGNQLAPGMRPYAARYGGHQFGSWADQLGDGRAITLGEAHPPGASSRLEFQLKGAGPTPYSRRADGRAVLRSSLREFVCSEAMHFLGVPTTRALSLVGTGEDVVRDLFYDGNPRPEPGAIVCRVAPSFLRFGNFEILASRGEHALLKQLADFALEEHFPSLAAARSDRYGLFFDEVARRTARLMAAWMSVGFVHGVMNTDNLSILGLTIDYGPYGWLEPYDPAWTPNTTDASTRRYRYGGQPSIGLWNIARFGEALAPLLGPLETESDRAKVSARLDEGLEHFCATFAEAYSSRLAAKLGWERMDPTDEALVDELFSLLAAAETDFTLFFRALGDWFQAGAVERDFSAALDRALYAEIDSTLRERWSAWMKRLIARTSVEEGSHQERGLRMNAVNPLYVPRNYLAQNAIRAAEAGDLSVLQEWMKVLERPYTEHPGAEKFAQKRPEWARNEPGCSALSCSS